MALPVRARFSIAAVLVSAVLPVSGQTRPNYAGYSDTQFIPFANANSNHPPFSDPPDLAFTVDGKPFVATMDTGSTGVVVSAADLPGYTTETASQYAQGWEFLSSSKRLWVGRWIPKEIVFQHAEVTATVPILALESVVICPHYNISTDGPGCPPSGGENGTSPQPTLMPHNTSYMGVGFGREHGGFTQGTPDRNPLLNIKSTNHQPVTNMRTGYIVTPEGVHVGLTRANTADFAFTRLTGPKAFDDPRAWPMASFCVSVNGSVCFPGSVLVDTGIPQMYLSVPGLPMNVISASNPSEPGHRVLSLPSTTKVNIMFHNPCAPVAYYNLIVGDYSNPMQPEGVIVSADGVVYVNTGRHFLRNFNVLFDADAGAFGLRWIGSADSSYGGTYL